MICCGKMFPTKYYVTNILMMLVVMLIMFGKTDNHLMSVGKDDSRTFTCSWQVDPEIV